MKKLFMSCVCLASFALFAASGELPPCNPDFRLQLVDKEGSFEFDAELLILTSSLSPIYETTFVGSFPPPYPSVTSLSKSDTARIHPEYDLGFALDLRYRTKTNSDVGLYYTYLHTNGQGTFKDDFTGVGDQAGTVTNHLIFDDSARNHNHMHIGDGLFGKTYPLSKQSVLRVAGGLSFYKLHYTVHYDSFRFSETTQGLNSNVTETRDSREQNYESWGVGPKLGIDLEYYLLPRCWKHDLNLSLDTQFSIYYTKEWSHGTRSVLDTNITPPNPPNVKGGDIKWKNEPGLEMTPSLHLDVGLRYGYHTAKGYNFNFGAGYLVFVFWYTEELFRDRSFQGEKSDFFTFTPDSDLIYSGPYARVSLAY